MEWGIGILLAAAFAGYRLWQALTGVPFIWQDSSGYQNSSLWSGVRPPVAPLLWRITGTPTSYIVVQTLIAIAAWCFLAWVAAMVARPGWPRLVTGAVVLAFACSMPVVIWDRSVLSESLSFSALALVFATAIRVTQRVTWGRVASLVAAALALALVRDSLLWMVAGLALAILAYAVVHNAGTKVLVLGIALLAVSGYALIGQAAAHRNAEQRRARAVRPHLPVPRSRGVVRRPRDAEQEGSARVRGRDQGRARARQGGRHRSRTTRRSRTSCAGCAPTRPASTSSGWRSTRGTCSPNRSAIPSARSTTPKAT